MSYKQNTLVLKSPQQFLQSDGGDYHYESSETERLHFVKFETKYIEHWLDFIQKHLVCSKETMLGKSIKATGGGAYKFAELIQQKLGLM